MIKTRLSKLREEMKKKGIDYYLIVTADPHASEYINDHYKEIEYFTGFTGSNAQFILGLTDAYLWTDGRYFVQAAKELEGSGIELMKMGNPGVPSLQDFLKNTIKENETLGFDGRLITLADGEKYDDIVKGANAHIKYEGNITYSVWNEDRPVDQSNAIFLLDEVVAGESVLSKIGKIRKKMDELGVQYYFLSKLDDQAWLHNIRGNDIAYNPVAYAYTLFEEDEVTVFLKNKVVTEDVVGYFSNLSIKVKDYENIVNYLSERNFVKDKSILLDKNSTNYFWSTFFKNKCKLVFQNNPTEVLKAVKNETEIIRSKDAYLKDSLAVTRFIKYIKESDKNMTESEAAYYLDSLREKIDGFIELSFPTISAYKENAAMMHYEAVPGKDKKLESNGILLVDSGGQYMTGTTDVTRSIVLGPIKDEIRKQYTKVCCGMLRLMNAKFMKGCSGINLDILAREPLWELGIDYKCGTGHGIGYILNVHEAPQRIAWQHRGATKPAEMQPGMIVSDEPGVYVEGSHGIRLETILLCKEFMKSDDGEFYTFEPLTLVPIDLEGIDPAWMEDKDIDMLNKYHELVYQSLSEFLEEDERLWLKEATKRIIK